MTSSFVLLTVIAAALTALRTDVTFFANAEHFVNTDEPQVEPHTSPVASHDEAAALNGAGVEPAGEVHSFHHQPSGQVFKLRKHHKYPTHDEIDAMYPARSYVDEDEPHLEHTYHQYHHVVGTLHDPTTDQVKTMYVKKDLHAIHDRRLYKTVQLPATAQVRLFDKDDHADDPRVERYLVYNAGAQVNADLVDLVLRREAPAAVTESPEDHHGGALPLLFSVSQVDRNANFFMRAILDATPVQFSDMQKRTRYTIDSHAGKRQGRYGAKSGRLEAIEAARQAWRAGGFVDTAAPFTNASLKSTTLWLLRTLRVEYQDIFHTIDLEYNTNWLPARDSTPEEDRELDEMVKQVDPLGTNALGDNPEAEGATATSHREEAADDEHHADEDEHDESPARSRRRGMHAQFWKRFTRWVRRTARAVVRAVRRVVRRVVSAVRNVVKRVVKFVKAAVKSVARAFVAIGKFIVKVVKTVVAVVKFLVNALTGNIDLTERLVLASYSYNRNPDGSFKFNNYENQVVIARYQYYFEVSFNVRILVKTYKLKQVRLTFRGEAGGGAEFILKEGVGEAEWSKLLLTVKLPTIKFFIGPVPVIIKLSLPITGKVTGTLEIKKEWKAWARAKLVVELGMNYEGGRMKWIATKEFTFEKHLDPLGEFEATVVVTPSVEVSLVASLYYIGGPFFTVEIGVENTLTVALASPECVVSFGMRGLVKIGIGAQVDFKIGKFQIFGPKVWGPANIATISFPIMKYCSGPSKNPKVPELPAPTPGGDNGVPGEPVPVAPPNEAPATSEPTSAPVAEPNSPTSAPESPASVPATPANAGSGSGGGDEIDEADDYYYDYDEGDSETHHMKAQSATHEGRRERKAARRTSHLTSGPMHHRYFSPQATPATSFTADDVGTAYEGHLVYNGSSSCADIPTREYSVQIADWNETTGVFVYIEEADGQDEEYSMWQATYALEFSGVPAAATDIVFVKVEDPEVDYDDTTQAPPVDFVDADVDTGYFEDVANDTIETVTPETDAPEGVSSASRGSGSISQDFVPDVRPVIKKPERLYGKISAGRKQIVIYDPDGCGNYLLRANETCHSLDDCGANNGRANGPPLVARWSRSSLAQPTSGAVADDETVFTAQGEALKLTTGETLWSLEEMRDGSTGRPVLVASRGVIVYLPKEGGLLGADMKTGEKLWASDAACGVPSANAAQPFVVAALRLGVFSCGGDVVAINLADGRERWRASEVLANGAEASTISVIGSSLARSTVFIGTSTNKLLALRGDTGDEKWQETLTDVALTAPVAAPTNALTQPVIYVAVGDGLVTLDSKTGATVGFLDLGGPIGPRVAVMAGGVFFTAGDYVGYWTFKDSTDTKATDPTWFDSLEGIIEDKFIVGTGRRWACLADTTGTVFMYAFSTQGTSPTLEWTYSAGAKLTGRLFRRGSHIIVTAQETVIGLDMTDGYPQFRFSTTGPDNLITSVGSTFDGLVVTTSAGETQYVYLPRSFDGEADPEDTDAAEHPMASFFQFDVSFAPRKIVEGVIMKNTFFSVTNTELVAYRESDGEERWREDTEALDNTLYTDCVVELLDEDREPFLAVGTYDGNLSFYRSRDGALFGRVALPWVAVACATSSDQRSIFVEAIGGVARIRGRAARFEWRLDTTIDACGSSVNAPFVVDGLRDLVIFSGKTCLLAVDQASGEVVFEPEFTDADVPMRISFPPVMFSQLDPPLLIVTSGNVITGIDVSTGEIVNQWSAPGKILQQPVLHVDPETQAGAILAISKGGNVYSFEPTEGSVNWVYRSYATLLGLAAVPLTEESNAVVLATTTSVQGLAIEDGALLWTYESSTPLVDMAITNPAQALVLTTTESFLLSVANGERFGRLLEAYDQVITHKKTTLLLADNGISSYPHAYFPPLPEIALPPGAPTPEPSPALDSGTTDMGISLAGNFDKLAADIARQRRQTNGTSNTTDARAELERSVKRDLAKMLGVQPEAINITSLTVTSGKINVNYTVKAAIDVAAAEKKAEGGTSWLTSTQSSMTKLGVPPGSMKVEDVSGTAKINASATTKAPVPGSPSAGAPAPTPAIKPQEIGAIIAISIGAALFTVGGVAVVAYVYHRSAVSRLAHPEASPKNDASRREPMMPNREEMVVVRAADASPLASTAAEIGTVQTSTAPAV